jgi:hypothetical protein
LIRQRWQRSYSQPPFQESPINKTQAWGYQLVRVTDGYLVYLVAECRSGGSVLSRAKWIGCVTGSKSIKKLLGRMCSNL